MKTVTIVVLDYSNADVDIIHHAPQQENTDGYEKWLATHCNYNPDEIGGFVNDVNDKDQIENDWGEYERPNIICIMNESAILEIVASALKASLCLSPCQIL